MKALVYHGPRNVSVDNVADAKIENPTDVLVRITTTNICGSDLHMYEGRTDMEQGRVLGHENLGEVIEIGEGVDRVRSATVLHCRSTSAADFVPIVSAGCPRSASPLRTGARYRTWLAPLMGLRTWARTMAVRPNFCAYLMGTITV